MPKERVQKLMARANIASRRKSEEIIEEGRVQVNGKTITLGDKADPDRDTITVDGERLRLKQIENRYYVFHKPKNVLSSNVKQGDDPRSTVRELIPVEGHLFTIGRLDAESEGLMVLTNDGDLTNRLSHPRYEHTKTYKVTVYGQPSAQTIAEWENGIWLDGSRTAPCYIRVLEENPETTVLRIIMIEGRKRQIRRIASTLGHPVQKLVRTHIGQLGLGTLKRGGWYRLSEEEVAFMLEPAEEVKFIRRKNKKFHGREPVNEDE
ncbi:MAG: rRNA pseudouridine synthase [Anaerolineae bacterium]|nr:rRNA pseudouridine synthase [Anaerolineae bacterium]